MATVDLPDPPFSFPMTMTRAVRATESFSDDMVPSKSGLRCMSSSPDSPKIRNGSRDICFARMWQHQYRCAVRAEGFHNYVGDDEIARLDRRAHRPPVVEADQRL